MKLRTLLVIAGMVLIFWMLNTGISRASEIVLNDGTTVQGTITQMNNTSVSVNTSSGTVVIPRNRIVSIKLNDTKPGLVGKQVEIQLKNGNTVDGKLLREIRDYYIVQMSMGQLAVERKNVVSIRESTAAPGNYNEGNNGTNGEESGAGNNPQAAPESQSNASAGRSLSMAKKPASVATHRGYTGVSLGLDFPTGPDQPYSSPGFELAGRPGYQFMDYLAIEGSLYMGFGVWDDTDVNVSGTWFFLGVFLNLRPMIPLGHSHSQDIYFLIGPGLAGIQVSLNNSNYSYSTADFAWDFGMGYEHYVGPDRKITVGAQIVYHNLTYNSVSTNNGSIQLPYSMDASQTSLDFVVRMF